MQQQQAPATADFIPQQWSLASKNDYASPSSCVDCASGSQCLEPSCSTTDELTSFCTDQCVIVACNDPEHHTDTLSRCNLGYDDASSCVDCDEVQNFLQCCDSLYPCYVDHSRSPRVSQQSQSPRGRSQHHWDDSLTAALCNCEHMQKLRSHYPSTRITSSSNLLSPQHNSPSRSIPPSLAPTASSLIQPYTSVPQSYSYPSVVPAESYHSGSNLYSQLQDQPTYPHVESSTGFPLTCMWGNCQMQFKSPSELVEHVNLAHLHIQSESLGNQKNYPYSLPQNHDDKMPCLWENCSEPQFLSGDVTLSGLVNHLFQDHLGLLPPQGDEPYHHMVDRAFADIAAPQQPGRSQFQELPPGQGTSDTTTIEPVLNISTVAQKSCQDIANPHIQSQDASSSTSSSPRTVVTTIGSATSVGEAPPGDTHVCLWEGCRKSFDTCDDLMTHISAAHVGGGKPQYDCLWEGCNRNGDKGFSSKQKICRHLQSHTGYRPFQCPDCLQNFSEAATLLQHRRRHTQEKPYKCDFPGCGKSFAITGALTIHKRVHNGQKPFKCSFCGRGFAESSNLSKHLRTHTGERPYVCSEPNCGKAFARPDQLNRHMNVHRRKAPSIAI